MKKNIIYNIIFLFSLFLIIGCSTRQTVETKILTNTETVEVSVPVKFDRPDIECSFSGNGTEPMTKMLECIILQKKIIDEITERNIQWQ